MFHRIAVIGLWAALTAGASAQTGTTVSYQGELEQGGTPATGAFDFEFALYDAELGGSLVAGPSFVDDLFVDGGLFTAELDFGGGIFGSADLWLEIRIRDGSETGSFETLVPRQPVRAAPAALHAREVAAGAVGASDVDDTEVQLRIGTGCTPGEAIRTVNADGTVVCETDDDSGGDITAVTAGEGLVGGATTGDANIAVDFGVIRGKGEPILVGSSTTYPIQSYSQSSDAAIRLVSMNGAPLLEGGSDPLSPSLFIADNGDITTDGGVNASGFTGDGSQVTNVDAETLDGQDSTEFAAAGHTHPPDGSGVLFLSAADFGNTDRRQLNNAGRVDWNRSFHYVRVTDCITPAPCPSLSLIAPVRLPQGSEIDSLTLLHYDNDPSHDWRITAFLFRADLPGDDRRNLVDVAITSSSAADTVLQASDSPSSLFATVDNTQYAYFATAVIFDDDKALSNDLRFYGLRIDYTLPQ
ncbi:MAG: hypothetical protein ACNS61_06545 [Candidatus Wenzhouxiangella sp. M2_3B_020]